MKKFLKWGLIAIVVLIVIGAVSGNKGGSATTGQTNSTATPTPAPEAQKITARQLADDFDANQVSAEKNWGGKLVEFKAVVTNITDSGISFGNVASKQFSMAQISCRIKDKNQLMDLKNGQSVTVKGVVGKQMIGVIDLSDCEVVK